MLLYGYRVCLLTLYNRIRAVNIPGRKVPVMVPGFPYIACVGCSGRCEEYGYDQHGHGSHHNYLRWREAYLSESRATRKSPA
jgi:hypothetical protein